MIPEALYDPANWKVWVVLVAAVLAYPVRALVLTGMVIWAERHDRDSLDPAVHRRLGLRAWIVAAVLCLGFSYLYVGSLFDAP